MRYVEICDEHQRLVDKGEGATARAFRLLKAIRAIEAIYAEGATAQSAQPKADRIKQIEDNVQ